MNSRRYRVKQLHALGARGADELFAADGAQLEMSLSACGSVRLYEMCGPDFCEGGTGFEARVRIRIDGSSSFFQLADSRIMLDGKPLEICRKSIIGCYRSFDKSRHPIDGGEVLNPLLQPGARWCAGEDREGFILAFGSYPLTVDHIYDAVASVNILVIDSISRMREFELRATVVPSSSATRLIVRSCVDAAAHGTDMLRELRTLGQGEDVRGEGHADSEQADER